MATQIKNNKEQNNSLINGQYKEKVFYSKVFWSVPQSYVLVKENKMTGSVTIKNEGLRFSFPGLYRGKYLSIKEYNIDEAKIECIDSAGQKIYVDYEIKLRITDPYKYLYKHEDPEDDLRDNLKEIMRILAKSASWEELSTNRFGITNNGRKIMPIGNKKFDQRLSRLAQFINEFENTYGLKLISLVSKEVSQSQELQKAYDERIRKRKEGEAAIEAAKRRKEQAKIEAETRLINADAEAEAELKKSIASAKKLKAHLQAIQSTLAGNLSEEEAAQIISELGQTYLLTNGSNPNTNVFSSTRHNDLLKKAVVANISKDGEEKNTQQVQKKKK